MLLEVHAALEVQIPVLDVDLAGVPLEANHVHRVVFRDGRPVTPVTPTHVVALVRHVHRARRRATLVTQNCVFLHGNCLHGVASVSVGVDLSHVISHELLLDLFRFVKPFPGAGSTQKLAFCLSGVVRGSALELDAIHSSLVEEVPAVSLQNTAVLGIDLRGMGT